MAMKITGIDPKVGQVLTVREASGSAHYRVVRVYPDGSFDWERLPNRAERRKSA